MPAECLNWPNWLPRLLWLRRECPRCHSVKFKPAELRPFDGLLSMFMLAAVLLVCAAGRKCAMSTRLLAELTRLLRPA